MTRRQEKSERRDIQTEGERYDPRFEISLDTGLASINS
jgi:hypothetical protein